MNYFDFLVAYLHIVYDLIRRYIGRSETVNYQKGQIEQMLEAVHGINYIR